jgi:hypothetical protein
MLNMSASNCMTLAENTVTNVEGIAQQADLASQALTQVYSMVDSMSSSSSMSSCDYTYPAAPNASAHLMNAFYFEATLSTRLPSAG